MPVVVLVFAYKYSEQPDSAMCRSQNSSHITPTFLQSFVLTPIIAWTRFIKYTVLSGLKYKRIRAIYRFRSGHILITHGRKGRILIHDWHSGKKFKPADMCPCMEHSTPIHSGIDEINPVTPTSSRRTRRRIWIRPADRAPGEVGQSPLILL